MKTTRLRHFANTMAAASLHSIATLAVLTATSSTWAQSDPTNQPRQSTCIAIMMPTVEGVPGSAVDAAKGTSDLIASYLQGPSIRTVVLEAKLSSLATEEAKQKGCEPLLITSIRRKSSSRGFMKALAHGTGTASWNLPYGGSAASSAARTGTAAGLQTLSSMAQSTKAKDELSLEYRLQLADGKILLGPNTERRTAKVDGEDLLTPIVTQMAEAVVAERPESPARGQ